MQISDFANRFLSEYGNPKTIISVGAADDLEKIAKHFKSCQCIVIDAVEDRLGATTLSSSNGSHTIYRLNEVVAEKTGFQRLWRPRNHSLLHITSLVSPASTLSESDAPLTRCRSITDILKKNSLAIETPCMALLTIQGHGTSALKGSIKVLSRCSSVLVDIVRNDEISQTSIDEAMTFFFHHGFQLFSIDPVVHGKGLAAARHRLIFNLLRKK